MALALNKTTLKQQRDQLKMFKRFLPSLDLKRQQLLAALKKARIDLREVQVQIETPWLVQCRMLIGGLKR